MNRLITTSEIEAVIKKHLTHKSPGQDGFMDKFSKIQRGTNTYPPQTIPKNSRREKTPKLFLRGQYYPNSKTS